jgi:acetyl-CoA carboxylase biotin carboxyl carrier protein
MNIKEIRQLLNLISDHGLAEFELEREGTRISIKKYAAPPQTPFPPSFYAAASEIIPGNAAPGGQPVPATPQQAGNKDETPEEKGYQFITSPIVGTFYAAPAPDAAPYVSPGTKITPNDTVCIIEAMKVMNEIKAELSGTVEEILVENGQAVEFGHPLFRVKSPNV